MDVLRGQAVESTHRVHAVLVDRSGSRRRPFGDERTTTFWRSALKPFQVLPVLEEGAAEARGLGPEEIAVSCGSHGGRPEHVERVANILVAAGLGAESLHCGPHAPYDPEAAAALQCNGSSPGRIHNNCSGKHAALLTLVAHRGWDPDGYWRLDHPVQARIRVGLSAWIDLDPDALTWATDGCGLPTPRGPLVEMARAYARLGEAARRGAAPAPASVVASMTDHPDLTSAPGREPLVLMQATGGRLLAKEGAEGVLCVSAPADGWGMALKVEDGARRPVGPAAVHVLASSGLLSEAERSALRSLSHPALYGTTGEHVGSVRVRGADEA